MKVYKLPYGTECALPSGALSVALGNFDGVHIGHRRLLDAACAAAEQIPGCVSAVWTFSSLIKENMDVPALTTPEEKMHQFARAGIEYVILEDFSAVRTMKPETFVNEYLTRRLGCAAVVCGFNFRFGYHGSGDADTLSRMLGEHGVPVQIVQPVLWKNRIVSSTRIRAAIADGCMKEAAELLGRPFSIRFPVVYGNQLGRTIGVPTINQNFPAGHIIPRHGIYACLCTVGDRKYPAVANVGVRPSVQSDGHVNCETHIIDYDGFLYGQDILVEFCCRLRDEKKFDSVPTLRDAICADIAHAREYFAAPEQYERKKENGGNG